MKGTSSSGEVSQRSEAETPHLERSSIDWNKIVDRIETKIFLLSEDFTILYANRGITSSYAPDVIGLKCFEVFCGQGSELPCRGCPVSLLLTPASQTAELPTRPCRKIRCFPIEQTVDGQRVIVVEIPAHEGPSPLKTRPTAWLSEILQDWGAPVVAAAPDGTILVFNREAELLLGYKAEQVVGQVRAGAFLANRDSRELMEELRSDSYGGKGKFLSQNVRLKKSDGALVPVVLRGAILSDGDEELATVWFLQLRERSTDPKTRSSEIPAQRLEAERTMALQRLASGLAAQMRNPLTGPVLFSNILMQELVRRELQRADAFLWNLIQSSVDAVIATDTKGNIFIFNDEAARVLGYTADEVVGQCHISQIYPIEEARAIMRKLRSDDYGGVGKLASHDMELIHKNGEKIPVKLRSSLVFVGGQEFGSVGFFQDQRDRIKMEEELKQAQVQLLQSEKMASLGKLAAGIAHQINNPLSGIVLFSNLLLETPEIAEVEDWKSDLTRIADDAERCRSIVKELLEFARQTQQKIKPVDLNRALGQTIFLLEEQVLFHNIEIIKEFDESIPVIYADPQQLNHVLMNLILNAAEAMEGRGTLTITTRQTESQESVQFQISDTGCGIPEEIQSRVFEPFFTTKEVGKGTGLGLSMVYSIVERHGGTIRIDSQADAGTTFTVLLPVGETILE